MPSVEPADPGYRRLRYSRYADDHILGFVGPKREAEQVKDEIAVFLRDVLKLELSPAKTLITHARTGAARYLGYDIAVGHDQTVRRRSRRVINGAVLLKVPRDVAKAKAADFLQGGKPRKIAMLHNHDDYSIVEWYGAKYRGIVNYYKLAVNIHMLGRLRWVMASSMLKTLAGKHHSTRAKMAARFKAKVLTPRGWRVCFEAVRARDSRHPLTARFGEAQLIGDKLARIADPPDIPPGHPPKELVGRLARRACELCGAKRVEVEVHQVRCLGSLDLGTEAGRVMARMRRKTLVVCVSCHALIESRSDRGTLPPLESRMR
jgi:hypothetical protein